MHDRLHFSQHILAILQLGMGTIRGELDIMVGGAAVWARVGALVLSVVQLVILFACGFSGASFGQVFLQPRAAAVLTRHLTDEEEIPTKAGWGAIVGDMRRVASGDAVARPPTMRRSDFARSLPIKDREDAFKQTLSSQALRAYLDEQLIARRTTQLRQGVRCHRLHCVQVPRGLIRAVNGVAIVVSPIHRAYCCRVEQ